MKKNFLYLLKGLVLSFLILSLLFGINQIESPKYFYDNTWPTSATYAGFYQLPKDSIDVLFFGSSHAAAGFIPQELYNNYGITSYNLGCEQQNLLVSYYWLKEALHTQSPKVVILDTYMLHTYISAEPLNTSEACTRKAMDAMHWGKTKLEAVHSIAQNDPNQSIWSYFFTNIRFHTRWTGLSADDFSRADLAQHFELKGYAPLLSEWSSECSYSPFGVDKTVESQPMVPLMQEYLDKMVQLCSDNGIQLLLVKNMTTAENQAKHNATTAYAKEHSIRFIDFNERSIYYRLHLNFSADMADGDTGHMNLHGAIKTTNYLGKVLTADYGLASHTDTAWESTQKYYATVQDEYSLSYETSLLHYLDRINRKDYSIFISVRDEASSALTDEVIHAVHALGFDFDLSEHYRSSYLAVKTPDEQFEILSNSYLSQTGSLRNNTVPYSIVSAGYDCGNTSSIQINGAEFSKNGRGLNIVVYDTVRKTVVDSVCFDTFDPMFPATR